MNAPVPGARFFLTAVLALTASHTFALGLGEIDLRSFLGQPLDARIPVFAGPDEPLDDSCFKLVNGAVTSDTGHATPAKLSYQQIGRSNILQIRSSGFVPEPAVRIQIEVSCGNLSRISREYTLLLDPPEYAAARISLPAKLAAPAPTGAMQAEPIVQQPAAISASPSSGEGVTAGSGEGASSAAAINIGAAPAPRKSQRSRPAAPVATTKLPARATAPVARPAYQPAPETAPRAEKVAPPAPNASAAKPAPGDGFRLKLSSSEMNLSLTKTVTETDRQRLRARQLMLENQSDDQTATILSMKNSIKQMEAQLADLRRQMAAKSGAPVGNVVGVPDLTAPPTASEQPRAEAPTATGPPKPAGVAIPAAKPIPAKTASGENTTGFSLSDWTIPALAASAGALVLIFGVNYWRRRSNQNVAYKDLYADPSANVKLPQQAAGQFDENKLFEDATDEELEEILVAEGAANQGAAKSMDLPLSAKDKGDDRSLIDVQAPDSFKMAYLRERFPEIAQGSLRLDKPDSLIQAARLYYQEDNNSAKAAELLEYAIGEYPNEVRPWLAVFEIYRLENRIADFANLARRFKGKFEHGGYWPKVQAIGRQIDPENPLYITEELQSNEASAADATISAEAENWLNTPLDFSQDMLSTELRDALMDGDDLPSSINKESKPSASMGELSLSPEGKKPV